MTVGLTGLVAFGNPENIMHRMALENGLWGYVALLGLYLGAPIADDWLQTRTKYKD